MHSKFLVSSKPPANCKMTRCGTSDVTIFKANFQQFATKFMTLIIYELQGTYMLPKWHHGFANTKFFTWNDALFFY